MLVTRSVNPSQIGPFALSFRASAQSSIRASRMAAMPPMSRKVSARTSIHPPAAAAILRSARLTQENGYSIWKKKMNAGMRKHGAAGDRISNEPPQHLRRIDNIGIRQKKIVDRVIKGVGRCNPLAQRPELAGPSAGQRGPRHDPEPVLSITIGCGVAGHSRGAVAAVVVNHDDRPSPLIVLSEE